MDNEWISVEERLPDIGYPSSLISYGENIGHARLVSEDLWRVVASNDAVPMVEVTHWMPLPEPPNTAPRA